MNSEKIYDISNNFDEKYKNLDFTDQSNNSNHLFGNEDYPTYQQIYTGIGATMVTGTLAFLASRYHVANPSQVIAKTGLGVSDISITKNTLQLPFQEVKKISLEAVTLPIQIDAMSKQSIEFRMPSVWTIGPDTTNRDALIKYSKLLSDKGNRAIADTVSGVIQGECRVSTANMELEELFLGREKFKNEVTVKIQEVLKPFGLHVYNANIAELTDLDSNNAYFQERKKRALEKVNQEARVGVAEAIRDGETGEKEYHSQTRQNVAKYEKEATLVENDRRREVAESNKQLSVMEAGYRKEQEIAEVEAKAASQKKEYTLQKEVEELRKKQELERMRASEWAIASINKEIAITKAEGTAASVRLQAEADLFAKQKHAEGIFAERQAEAKGLQELIKSSGSMDHLNRYLMVRDNMLPALAEQQANAVRGMNPTVVQWNTGGGANGENSTLSQTMTDLFKTGMPLFDGLKHTTGYDFMDAMGVKKKGKDIIIDSKQE